jgi:hypothetical protein
MECHEAGNGHSGADSAHPATAWASAPDRNRRIIGDESISDKEAERMLHVPQHWTSPRGVMSFQPPHYWSPPTGYYRRWVGPSPDDVTRSNQEIQADIIDQLTYDTWPDFSQVYVAVQDGVVTLTGTVPLATEKWWAEMDAWQAAGVKDVHNRLRIGRA